jgi:hypothetical protein
MCGIENNRGAMEHGRNINPLDDDKMNANSPAVILAQQNGKQESDDEELKN